MEQPNSRMTRMDGKVCMVTGANSGIGKATALGLAKMGATVVMVCRNQSRGEAARTEIVAESGNEAVDLMIADLSSQGSIRQLAKAFKDKYRQLHVLVNNAGGIFGTRSLTVDGLETTFALNHLSYFLLTNLLLDVLKASAPARIVNVASGAAHMGTISFNDLQSEKKYGRRQAYSQSKLANILFTYGLAKRLKGTGVTANCLHPGNVRTNLGGVGRRFRLLARKILTPSKFSDLNMKSPEEGAETSIYLASSPEVEGVSGKYFVDKREAQSPEESRDEAIAQRLWEVSERLVKPSP